MFTESIKILTFSEELNSVAIHHRILGAIPIVLLEWVSQSLFGQSS